MEEWKTIPGYEGLYEVSSDGRVRSLNYQRTGKIQELKLTLRKEKYFRVTLGKNGVNELFRVHQLVAIVFLGHVPNKFELVVDHINSNPKDNRVENLQILTNRKNSSKGKKGNLPTGVSKINQKFRSVININGQSKRLGYFSTSEEASEAYQKELKNI